MTTTGAIDLSDPEAINAAMAENNVHARALGLPEVTIVDKREQARQEAAQRAQVATNVRNTAGALWWANQGHHQRGDHVQAAQCHIARGRMLAEAKRQGIPVG